MPFEFTAPLSVSVQVALRATAATARAAAVVGAFVSRVEPPPHEQHIRLAVKSSSSCAINANDASIAAATAGDIEKYGVP